MPNLIRRFTSFWDRPKLFWSPRSPVHKCRSIVRIFSTLNRDQRGSMSIASLFAILLLVMLLGMVMNSTRQVDRKVKMQNAADAATHSGGVVIARSMNTLAFTNHLLSDVFALTAFMREARDQNAASLTPEILDHWRRVGPHLASSEFPKIAELGEAIVEKTPLEEEMIRTWSEWWAAVSEQALPVLEQILADRAIPEFQRALVENTPRLAQAVTDEVAQRHGESWPREVELRGALWRTFVDPVNGMSEEELRTLPVVDPVEDMIPGQADYMEEAREQRRHYAHMYLKEWNDQKYPYPMQAFQEYAEMSQFAQLWRNFTCGQLEQLLEDEYPDTNLPMQIRETPDQMAGMNDTLERDYMYVGVVYADSVDEHMPIVFKKSTDFDQQAYAQVFMFTPRRRLLKTYYWNNGNNGGGGSGGRGVLIGGGPGKGVHLPSPPPPPPRPRPPAPPGEDPIPPELRWNVIRQDHGRQQRYGRFPETWNLMTQNWTVQLTPATTSRLVEILRTPPDVNGISDINLPTFENLDQEDLRWLSHH